MIDLNTAVSPDEGWRLDVAWDISDRGQIVGAGSHAGRPHAFRLTPRIAGDMNCDAGVDEQDVGAFVLALLDPNAYAEAFGACAISNGDMNADGFVDGDDISAFVGALIAP